MTRLWALLALLVVVGACELRADASVIINEDESGTFGFEVSLDDELRELLSQQGQELDLAAQLGDLPAGWTSEAFTEGDFEGVRASRQFSSFDELESSFVDLAESDLGGLGSVTDLLISLDLVREGDQFGFTAAIGDVSGFFDGALGGGNFGGIDPAALFDTILKLSLTVVMPGEVIEHNGDAVDGTAVTWQIDLDTSGRTLSATSELAGTGPDFKVIVGIVAAIAIFALGLLLVQRRNRHRAVEFMAAAGEGLTDG